MSGRMFRVEWFVLACFLSLSSGCDSKPEQTAKPAGGAVDPEIIKRGNCMQSKGTGGGGAYNYCYYTWNKPLCTTALSECESNPPSGKCSTTPPVQKNPPPC
jgi:hypothetical protein